MADKVTISVDALGGDNAPKVVLEGVEQALAEDGDLSVILCGPAEVVEPFAAAHDRCVARATTEEISMAEHPANAVRKKKDSSIVVGCRLVKEGEAQGFFSAGSTGACLAAGTLVIGRIKGVARPALATLVPSPAKPVVLCDVGANADCKPEYLVQFAEMASIYARKILGVADPKVGLLNIGEEEEKGSQFAQEAHALLKEKVANFGGNAEGRDVMDGPFDVVVCDGFTGNVCLKTIEGTAKVLFGELKSIMMSSLKTKLGAMALKGGLKGLMGKIDPDAMGGAPLLGCKGACIVGHGSSNARAIKNGVLASAAYVRSGVSELIAEAVQK
ncbi:MAG: phosphate acyltransferase PlsX [Eggerthellaceae bacterium]|nr:phosphate acyltransferase PlsX [Eggerthellaceae bacterium]